MAGLITPVEEDDIRRLDELQVGSAFRSACVSVYLVVVSVDGEMLWCQTKFSKERFV